MASRTGNKDTDLWAEIASEGEEEPQIAVVYGRRRPDVANPEEVQIESIRRSRVSFAPSRRTSWKRSLSTRGRESIVVAAGIDLRPQLKQRGGQGKPKQGARAKKGAQEPLDLGKEKAYFAEVDSFELLEESPSPKNFGNWVMGAEQVYVVHDLPSILERWRISKLAYSCRGSQPLFKIMETPTFPSGESSGDSGSLIDKTPERVTTLRRIPLDVTSYQRSNSCNTSRTEGQNVIADLNEKKILSSFNALRIKEEDITTSEGEILAEVDAGVEVDGAIRKDTLNLCSKSLGGECLSAFTQLLMACRQSAPVTLSEVFSKYCDPSSIVKIGEGTYGEAFRAGNTVCKVVPFDGDILVNGEVQKKSDEVLEEVMLSLTLNNLRVHEGENNIQNSCTSFIDAKDFKVCRGTYDASLISAWEDWDAENGSENDHPREFSEEQCYIVFVLADGGKDLESFVLSNFTEAQTLLAQVSAALAVAEAACEFEHRDLHWGNILLNRNDAATVDVILQGRKLSIKTFGLTISIIDFTLSRINTGKAVLFLDLSLDPELFKGPKGDRQSETYRRMKEITEECWEGSFPKTNVLWLMYLVDILLNKKSFKRTPKDERDLRSFKKRLNSYDSAKDSLFDSFFSSLVDDYLLKQS